MDYFWGKRGDGDKILKAHMSSLGRRHQAQKGEVTSNHVLASVKCNKKTRQDKTKQKTKTKDKKTKTKTKQKQNKTKTKTKKTKQNKKNKTKQKPNKTQQNKNKTKTSFYHNHMDVSRTTEPVALFFVFTFGYYKVIWGSKRDKGTFKEANK